MNLRWSHLATVRRFALRIHIGYLANRLRRQRYDCYAGATKQRYARARNRFDRPGM